MKKYLFPMLLMLIFSNCFSQKSEYDFSQKSKYEYTGRSTPAIKEDRLKNVDFITDVMPEFSRYFHLWNTERYIFNEKINWVNFPLDVLSDPQYNYTKIIEFVSIEISGNCQGKKYAAKSTGDRLTLEQKNILNTIDLGSDIDIAINFVYKGNAKKNLCEPNKIREGSYTVTVVPDTEAEYPGGNSQLTAYLNAKVFDKIPEGRDFDKTLQATVNFKIDAEGQVVDVNIPRSSYVQVSDSLLLQAFKSMPKWKPAKNSKGIKVKQEFSIWFGGGC